MSSFQVTCLRNTVDEEPVDLKLWQTCAKKVGHNVHSEDCRVKWNELEAIFPVSEWSENEV